MPRPVSEAPPGGMLLSWLPPASSRAAAWAAAPVGAGLALLLLHGVPLPAALGPGFAPALAILPLAAAGLAGGVSGGAGAVLLMLLGEALLLLLSPGMARLPLLAGLLPAGLLVAGLAGLLRQRLEAERRLHARQRRLEALAGAGSWQSFSGGGALRLSPSAWALLQRPAEAAPISTGRFHTLLCPEDVEPLREALRRAHGGRTPLRAEFRALLPGGGTRWLELVGEPQPDGGQRGVLLDIDARKQARQDCDTALARQETLNRELVHRVRNTFQLMISLLRLQQRQAVPAAVPALEAALHRVQSMALVHADLYPAAVDGAVRLEAYLPGLAQAVLAGSPRRPAPALRLEVAPLLLATDHALLLGLALCEGLDNALRHAWPEGEAGTLSLRLTLGESEAELLLEDDGRGLPARFTFGEGGLGLLLLQSSAQQLAGSLALEAGPPSRIRIRFPRAGNEKTPPGYGRG